MRESHDMKIGIITAMPEEYRAVAAVLGNITATRLGTFRAGRSSSFGHEFTLVESGMGFGNASRAAGMLISDGQPALLISTGFCGGITPELQAGDVVVAEKIIIMNESGFEEVPVLLSGIGRTFIAQQAAAGARAFGGVFVSSAVITSKAHLSGLLPGYCPNQVVEMESGAIALIAAENNIPLLALRAVSDTAAEELGFSLDEFCDPDMRGIKPYRVLLTVLRKPLIIPQLARLFCSSRRAAESMTAALPRLFFSL